VLNWLPENVSTYGKDIDWIFYCIYYITTVALVLVLAGMAWFLIKYRRPQGWPRPLLPTATQRLKSSGPSFPALVFVMIGFMSRSVWARCAMSFPKPTCG